MPGFSVQFHATPPELTAFVARWLSAHSLHAVATWYRPFRIAAVDGERVGSIIDARPDRLVFSPQPISLDARNSNDVLDHTPGFLKLDVGGLSEKGLGESHLSTSASSDAYKAIYRDLKKATASGATAVNEAIGASGPARANRYTPGAQALYKDGVKMLTLGSNVLRFD